MISRYSKSPFIKLKNKQGVCAEFLEFGARWVSMFVPDKKGVLKDVVLGFNSLSEYKEAHEKYYGAVVGRVCGRISNACFSIGNKTFYLSENDIYGKDKLNHLHGGVFGFHLQMWNHHCFVNDRGEEGVIFQYVSKDGEEGYPGELNVKVKYLLTNDNVVEFSYEVTTSASTYVNLTNHAFFNLSGNPMESILNHHLYINSNKMIESDEALLPTGNYIDISNDSIRFDLNNTIEGAVNNSKILKCKDFSIAYVLNHNAQYSARMLHSESGRYLNIYTDRPSLQVYNGYLLNGQDIGKGGISLNRYAGMALEPQDYPNAPNQPMFPSILLEPGKVLYSKTCYEFGVL